VLRYRRPRDRQPLGQRLSVEFCYCSVFDECWSVKRQMREQVNACVPDPHLEFVPKPREQIV